MKNLKFLLIGLLFVGVAGLTSCKKEKKIERNLWNKGGEWNIVKVENNWGDLSGTDSDISFNIGTYKFDKGGSGKITVIEGGESESNLFNYENTENSLTLIYKEGPMVTEGYKEEFTLDWEKDKIELYSYEEDEEDFSFIEVRITLEKK